MEPKILGSAAYLERNCAKALGFKRQKKQFQETEETVLIVENHPYRHCFWRILLKTGSY